MQDTIGKLRTQTSNVEYRTTLRPMLASFRKEMIQFGRWEPFSLLLIKPGKQEILYAPNDLKIAT